MIRRSCTLTSADWCPHLRQQEENMKAKKKEKGTTWEKKSIICVSSNRSDMRRDLELVLILSVWWLYCEAKASTYKFVLKKNSKLYWFIDKKKIELFQLSVEVCFHVSIDYYCRDHAKACMCDEKLSEWFGSETYSETLLIGGWRLSHLGCLQS